MQQQDTKSIFTSKTFWLNTLAIIVAVIGITSPDTIGVKAETLLWISGVVNIILRFLTHGSVSVNPTQKDTTQVP